jgi:hypothetical protein
MMRKGIATGLLLVGVTANAAHPAAIPAEYQGSWSMDPAYCNYEGDTLDNELYVTADTVGFHAEHHRVKSLKVRKGKVYVRYFSMKDATRVPPKKLVLSNNGMLLNGSWHRCPKAAGEQ